MAALDAWDDVVNLMARTARARDDGFLFTVSEHLRANVHDHKETGDGCPACRGHVDSCEQWGRAQEIMLSWLIERAGGRS